jgi:Domain of unknown function (DUF4159)
MKRNFLALFMSVLAAGSHAPAQYIPQAGDRRGVPRWELDPAFAGEAFTFARLQPRSHPMWSTDFPDSDLNFSYRLQQMTSLKVNPDPVVIPVTDEALVAYPFVYLVDPRTLYLDEDEAAVLRRYLLNGGFLMIDDFWGEEEWAKTQGEVRKIFPDREIKDLPIEHPIFHCVFDLKEKPQVPAIEYAIAGRYTGQTWEKDGKEPHYRAIFDDKGRMMMLICQNTDLGDGWEREGDNEWFFREFSEKRAYPMGINIVFYVMTH